MYAVPKTLDDILSLIQFRVQEDIHLEYKASQALTNSRAAAELAKDTSAFANSDGGVIIYGVKEDRHLPVEVDEGLSPDTLPKEWIENILTSNIAPRIEGLRIHSVEVAHDRFLYVVEVPKSYHGPHQERQSHRYYKRYNFKSEPMEDYEIQDLRQRRVVGQPLVSFEIAEDQQFFAAFDVRNVGEAVASEIRFEFPPNTPWPGSRGMPPAFRDGIKALSPRQRLRFRFFPFNQILGDPTLLGQPFIVRASYYHPLFDSRTTSEWEIDFEAYRESTSIISGVERELKKVVEGLTKVSDRLNTLVGHVDNLRDVTGPTGLKLSLATLRNLRRIVFDDAESEPIDPTGQHPSFFQEVLGVDRRTAETLMQLFYRGATAKDLDSVPELSDDLREKMRTRLALRTDEEVRNEGS